MDAEAISFVSYNLHRYVQHAYLCMCSWHWQHHKRAANAFRYGMQRSQQLRTCVARPVRVDPQRVAPLALEAKPVPAGRCNERVHRASLRMCGLLFQVPFGTAECSWGTQLRTQRHASAVEALASTEGAQVGEHWGTLAAATVAPSGSYRSLQCSHGRRAVRHR